MDTDEFFFLSHRQQSGFVHFHNFRSRNDLHARTGKPQAVTRAAHRFFPSHKVDLFNEREIPEGPLRPVHINIGRIVAAHHIQCNLHIIC